MLKKTFFKFELKALDYCINYLWLQKQSGNKLILWNSFIVKIVKAVFKKVHYSHKVYSSKQDFKI